MRGFVGRTYETKYNATLQVAAGAGSVLIRSKHRLSVYGHSTEWVGSGERAVVYRIKAVNESEDSMLRRLRTLQEGRERCNNADATAIEAVAQTLSSMVRQCAYSSSATGSLLAIHTVAILAFKSQKSVVDGLRSKGIEVYSLSIDADAISPNNEIYGERITSTW